jgi:tRNA-modifying protein YgfZ
MARLKSMGQVRRRLVHVAGAGAEAPPTPAPVFAGARQVGEVRSAVRAESGGWTGLAMVSLLHVAPGAALSFTPECAAEVRVGDIA